MGRDRGGHQFAHWFLYSSAYESWRGLDGWFGTQPADEVDDEEELAPAGETLDGRRGGRAKALRPTDRRRR